MLFPPGQRPVMRFPSHIFWISVSIHVPPSPQTSPAAALTISTLLPIAYVIATIPINNNNICVIAKAPVLFCFFIILTPYIPMKALCPLNLLLILLQYFYNHLFFYHQSKLFLLNHFPLYHNLGLIFER